MFLLSTELWTSTYVWCLENRRFLSYSLHLKKKKNCVCVFFFFSLGCFTFRAEFPIQFLNFYYLNKEKAHLRSVSLITTPKT